MKALPRFVFPLVLLGALPAAADEPPKPRAAAPDVLHIPTLERRAEQGILRAVPIAVELPGDVALRARRVLVHYRLWGDPDWTTLELRRAGTRYAGAVPCREISTVTGDLKYYIRVHDVEGRVIATGASLAAPYRVTIKHDAALAPGRTKTAKCPDPADCPAGLPGCPSERVVDIPCRTDRDCDRGMSCGWRGFCERIDRRNNWISASIEQDFGVIETTGACSVFAQENQGTACYRGDGEQFVGNPVLTNEPLGFGRGPTRVVLGFDRLVHYGTSIGARVGWAVLGEGPTSRGGTEFVPLSIAVRATHWFGDDPFGSSRLRPFAFITGGYGMFDIETETRVRLDPKKPGRQGGNDLEQTVELWKRAGDGFVGVGVGLAVPLPFTHTAAFVELGILESLPFGALLAAPSAGLVIGF